MADDVRLRQVVIAAAELEPVCAALESELGLRDPFADPGVGLFGLHNAVYAIGDQFLEVIAPTQPDTAVDRWLERHGGDGGYMLLFEVADIAAARERAANAGVRTVWSIDLPDIGATHLHPADLGGAIVSVDQPVPPGAWRWGGPGWEERAVTGAVLGATVELPDAEAARARWTEVLGADLLSVRFAEAPEDRGATEFVLALGGRGGEELEIGGVRLRLEPHP
jgi:hypothetical protein